MLGSPKVTSRPPRDSGDRSAARNPTAWPALAGLRIDDRYVERVGSGRHVDVPERRASNEIYSQFVLADQRISVSSRSIDAEN